MQPVKQTIMKLKELGSIRGEEHGDTAKRLVTQMVDIIAEQV